jgi:hypothetical protein
MAKNFADNYPAGVTDQVLAEHFEPEQTPLNPCSACEAMHYEYNLNQYGECKACAMLATQCAVCGKPCAEDELNNFFECPICEEKQLEALRRLKRKGKNA